jgi:2-polyprenyl-3-methyl-5-hydroxy-6-metoxy-1,4-benzoquinol methylase
VPSAVCPACLNPEVQVFETLNTDEIAERWASVRFHGAEASAENIRRYVRADIASDCVEMLRCDACGLEFACPSRTWSSAHYPYEEHRLGWDHEQALAELGLMAPSRVLDVGCADGQFLARAASLGHTVTGVDFSYEDIEASRRKGFEAYVADLSRENALVDGNRRFDVITLFQVIEHLELPDLVFEQLGRLAEPGASLMLGCPSTRRYTRAFRHPDLIGSSDFWDCPPQHSLRWTPGALEAFAGRHGWAVSHVAYEPLALVHAAAHLAGLSQFGSRWTRRAATLWYFARLRLGSSTGIRLYFRAFKTGRKP